MKKRVSIIVPCFNEEQTVELFYKAVTSELHTLNQPYELIFVDDGSKDLTSEKVKLLRTRDKRIALIRFSRNFGKEAAMLAGLRAAKGDYVVIMDADLQHPPSLLGEMIETLESGEYDTVAAFRVSGKKNRESLLRRMYSRLFYSLINRMSDIELRSGSTDFRMMTRKVVDSLLQLNEYNRFSKGLFEWIGFRTKYISYENVERVAGRSRWNVFKLFSYAMEGITSFSIVPLRFSMVIGFISASLSFLYMVYVIIRKLVIPSSAIEGFPTLLSFILFLGGLILISLGVIGEYLGKVYQEVKNRPHYIISEWWQSHGDEEKKDENLHILKHKKS